jgi:hypothetical protein
MTRLTLLLVALALVACESVATEASGSGAVDPAPTTPGCTADADCPDDLACVLATGTCSARGALPYLVSLNVVPPATDAAGASSSWVQTQWVDLDPGDSHERNLTLSTPLVLQGSIDLLGLGAGPANPCYLPTSVVATTAADITDWVPYRFTGTILPDAGGTAWRYHVAVLPDRAYRLTVFIGVDPACPSTEAGYPPVVVERFVSAEAGGATLDVVAPPLAAPLSGHLGFDDGSPVRGVRLVAASPDGSTTFGASVTDADGAFQLRLPEGMSAFVLTARATADFPQFPEQAIDGSFLADTAAKGPFDVTLPTPPALVEVRLLARDAAGVPQPGVDVALSGVVAGGTVSMAATTDDLGLATVQVYPGGYTLVATPADGSPSGTLAVSVPIEGGDLPLDLPAKAFTHLQVLGEPTGEGVAGASLFLSLVQLADATVAVDRSYHVVADETGAIDTLLEPGTWRVLIVPAASTGLPRWAPSDQQVPVGGATLPVTVPAPWVMHGRVVDPAGQPVPNAAIEALSTEQVRAPSAALGAADGYNERGLSAIIGETVTDAEGRFVLALPFAH